MRHDLKTWPAYWREVAAGRKTAEIRRDDRGFRVGDRLVLREFDQTTGSYTGNVLHRTVTHIATPTGLLDGYVCLSLGDPR